ncbi:hypothetical protein Vretimale_12251 [Volvox reticuliferus]|uniref:WHEP-TRS domain-containing protein n=1 Tax=Volvox reticuliferus TaxID=1737510 RepID=A0A8J4GJ79_9CHLO|nr:hypothetical protein Vretifemale_8963 [Volvox reticuliferus]GIM08271.1 hypothetical protein Vretimale_12251 [Volvox reticuliferus]
MNKNSSMLKKALYGSHRRAYLRGMQCVATGQRHPSTLQPRQCCLVVMCMAKPWRPTIDDVDSISRGGPAKVRGTGSRRIPHRLNTEERNLYDLAKKKGFLAVRGTAYRKFRHGNPLPNIFRQWCDARGQVCVVVEQDLVGNRGTDRVVVDLAPLRLEDTTQVELLLLEMAAESGLRRVDYTERPADALPFNILPPELDGLTVEVEDAGCAGGRTGAATAPEAAVSAERFGSSSSRSSSSSGNCCDESTSSGRSSSNSSSCSASVEELRQAVSVQAEVVRQLKGQGLANKDPVVQEHVRILMQLKADLAQAEAPPIASSPKQPQEPELTPVGPLHPAALQRSNGRPTGRGQHIAAAAQTAAAPAEAAAPRPRSPYEHYYSLPIWQIHAVPLFFEGSRTSAKQFASRAVQRVVERARQAVSTATAVYGPANSAAAAAAATAAAAGSALALEELA